MVRLILNILVDDKRWCGLYSVSNEEDVTFYYHQLQEQTNYVLGYMEAIELK